MKSIKRGERLTILLIVLFLLGMVLLVARIVSQATFYMSHSHNVKLGYIYDRNGAVLFDENATAEKYGADYFLDVGNLIGDNSGRMTNTLVSENLKDLQNYNLLFGAVQNGKSAIYTTLDHDANQQVYQSFGEKNGTAIAYNYQGCKAHVASALNGLCYTVDGYKPILQFHCGCIYTFLHIVPP